MKCIYLILLCFTIPALGQEHPVNEPASGIQVRIHIPQKPLPVNIDNKPRLIYEVHLGNMTAKHVGLLGFSLVDLKKGKTILQYDSIALAGRLRALTPGAKDSGNIMAPGTTYILYIEATAEGNTFPVFVHRYNFRKEGQSGFSLVKYQDTLLFVNPAPVVLSSPLKGGNWAAIYSPVWERGHRRVVYTVDGKQRIPGRFAIDFMKLDSIQYVQGNEDSINNWYGYAQEVLAVADGEVASVRDDFPESPTLSAHPDYRPEQATGNYISLKIADSRYVFYEHLKPGSIRVRPGQRVKKGQVIALLGFTGQTTGPHLHFHVADSNSPLGAEGLPFVFEKFTQTGSYPDFSKFGKEKFIRIPARKIRREMPASNTVVVFN